MNSRDIEARVKKIEDLIGELHNELFEDDKTATISTPCLGMGVTPNGNEMELWFKIGRAEEA